MLRPARASARFACATASACCATATDGCCDSAELTAAWRVTGTWASAGPADVATTASDMTRIKTRRVHTFTRRSEEHTSELQSRLHLVCRLLLEKKKI